MTNNTPIWMLSASLLCSTANAIDLNGTLFDKAATAHHLDPLLVYSVALAESATGRGDHAISPWPWALRTPDRSFYARSAAQAQAKLSTLQQQQGQAIDVGLMQVNLYWHGHRVSSPANLLDPETNAMIGAAVLSEATRSSPQDLELGVGRYHTWKDETRARQYGRRVLAIYRNLRDL